MYAVPSNSTVQYILGKIGNPGILVFQCIVGVLGAGRVARRGRDARRAERRRGGWVGCWWERAGLMGKGGEIAPVARQSSSW